MEKEIKLSERELLVLIKQFSQIELILNLKKISLRILDERFIELAKKLSIKEIEYIAKNLAETILIQENYPCDKDIHCCISFENMDINLNMKIKKGQTTRDYVHYDEEEDYIIDARDDEINEYYDELLEQEYTYDNERNLIDNTTKDNEPVDVDELNNDLDEALKQ